MTLTERAAAVGIDPDDPKYQLDRHYGGFGAGEVWCRWCSSHATTRPTLWCDVAQAEYAAMNPEARCKCPRCREPFERAAGDERPQPYCPRCEAKGRSRRRRSGSGATYIEDGHGCVDRVSFAEVARYPEWFRRE